uniref:Alpha-ketoglutarate-dependent dioxygenase AlkB-like domain-containing protein n=1 Tax=Eutreptiella gymnastica TaxID=73025 RepID=A0A7S1IC66_9EUGL
MTAACISAGTKFGSIEQLVTLRQEEDILASQPDTAESKVETWVVDPPTREEPHHDANPENATDEVAQTEDKDVPPALLWSSHPEDDMVTYTKDSESKYKFGTIYTPTPKDMELQRELATMEHVEAPEGLKFIPNYISESEEQSLLQLARGWTWDQEVSTRQTAQFGFHYEYKTQNIREGRPWPGEIDRLKTKLVEDKIFQKTPDEMIATKLTPPQGFGAHIDHTKHFGPTIVNLGMYSDINVILIDWENRRYHVLRSERRSLIVLEGDARYKYAHAIMGGLEDEWKHHIYARGLRISLTLRNMILQRDAEESQ